MNTAKKLCPTLLLTGVAALAFSGPVAAEHMTEERVVTFADLNLDQPAGVQTLYGRIRGAARSVCIAVIGRNPLLGSARRDCTREALADAIVSVNDDGLTAYFSKRTGKSGVATIASR